MFAPMVYIRIFTQDAALTAFSEWSIRIYMAASLLFGAQLACQQTFIAIGDSKTSLFLALLRERVILLVPLAPHPAQSHRQRHGDLCGRAYRRHPGQCHHPDFVPLSAEKAAAHREGRSEG